MIVPSRPISTGVLDRVAQRYIYNDIYIRNLKKKISNVWIIDEMAKTYHCDNSPRNIYLKLDCVSITYKDYIYSISTAVKRTK